MRRPITVFLIAFAVVMVLPALSSLGTGHVRVFDVLPAQLVVAFCVAAFATLILEVLAHLWLPGNKRIPTEPHGGNE